MVLGLRRTVFFFVLHPIYYPRTTLLALPPSLPPSLPVVTQIRGHIAGPPPPSRYGTRLHFYRGKNSAFPSLVDSRRIVDSTPD